MSLSLRSRSFASAHGSRHRVLMKVCGFVAALLWISSVSFAEQAPLAGWPSEWPKTDFGQSSVAFSEIRSGGPPKDGIPAIDDPRFETLQHGTASGWAKRLSPTEPVIAIELAGDARAYPVEILMWHEIVNDTIGGVAVTITYCPLCNSALAFRRSLDGRVLDFGTTGKLRNSDLVMYDRQTESWWQQFTGEAIVGTLTGSKLRLVPSSLASFGEFASAHPDSRVLVPTSPNARDYGRNPYVGYDASGRRPFLYDGELPPGIDPMERVVAVETGPDGYEAWPLTAVRELKEIRHGDLVIRWQSGQASALDAPTVAGGRDVGSVTVVRISADHTEPLVFDTPFAFAFHAFRPDSPIHVETQ